MSGFLARACASSRQRVAASGDAVDLERLRRAALQQQPGASLATALRASGVSVIAEIKRASPSKGDLAAIADPTALAAAYVAGGAAAVSVLTEPHWFKGDLDDLRAVAAAVDVPALRKDFVVDPYQVWEARLAGAGAVLLIVAALDPSLLADLLAEVDAAGLDALVEVHAVEEAAVAAAAHHRSGSARALILGVNARDLSTLAVDTGQFARVRASIQEQAPAALLVAESGVSGPDDIARLAREGAHAVLVGEHVATAPDPRAAVAELVDAGRGAAIDPSAALAAPGSPRRPSS